MGKCLPNTTVVLDETPLQCDEFINTDCVLYMNAISYLNLPPQSTVTEIVVALLTSLIDTRARLENVENNSTEIKIEAGENIEIIGIGEEEDPYIISSNFIEPPFDKANNSFFPRGRDESQFGNIGSYSYDFSSAVIGGSSGDPESQVGSIGVNPLEEYGALGNYCFARGYNVSAEGSANSVFGLYNHSDKQSYTSLLNGRNNYNDNGNSLISGSFNQAPYTYLGHKVIFGNGNVVNGTAGLTSGVALLNKSFGTTVLGQANLDYTNTEQSQNLATAPILIVGNGNVNLPFGKWVAASRSNAFELLRNGLATLPSVTNTLIAAASGKAIITKEYLPTVAGNYANDSAAASGGVLVGQMYHTAGVVKIRLV